GIAQDSAQTDLPERAFAPAADKPAEPDKALGTFTAPDKQGEADEALGPIIAPDKQAQPGTAAGTVTAFEREAPDQSLQPADEALPIAFRAPLAQDAPATSLRKYLVIAAVLVAAAAAVWLG